MAHSSAPHAASQQLLPARLAVSLRDGRALPTLSFKRHIP